MSVSTDRAAQSAINNAIACIDGWIDEARAQEARHNPDCECEYWLGVVAAYGRARKRVAEALEDLDAAPGESATREPRTAL